MYKQEQRCAKMNTGLWTKAHQKTIARPSASSAGGNLYDFRGSVDSCADKRTF